MGAMTFDNLMSGPPETRLPEDPAAADLAAAKDPAEVAARHPASSLAWSTLAEAALADGRTIEGYAFARTGYHRGLDALRRNGWKGHGPVPWEHEPNRGFLRCLASLSKAAGEIGEKEEEERCATFLRDSSATGAQELGF
jgi:Protein of unknown function (DUF3151)